jgi:hypothetical protein
MTRHKKHDDILDVQIRTKILDQYGNPIDGAIEYDPSTGMGKRIKDPTLGLVEDFYCKDGSIELDGQNFDDTNHNEDEIDSIREMITLKVSRNDPDYNDMLKAKVNQKRDEKTKQQQQARLSQEQQTITPATITTLPDKIIATTQIAKGEEITIDLATGQARGIRSDNIHRPADATNKA